MVRPAISLHDSYQLNGASEKNVSSLTITDQTATVLLRIYYLSKSNAPRKKGLNITPETNTDVGGVIAVPQRRSWRPPSHGRRIY